MVGWIGICLPIQRTWDHSLVWEDSTYHGATKACGLQLLSPQAAPPEARAPSACAPPGRSHHREKPTHRNKEQPRSLRLEKARVEEGRPRAIKKNLSILYIKPGQRECSG